MTERPQTAPRPNDPRRSEPRTADSRAADAGATDQRTTDQRTTDPPTTDARATDPPTTDARATDQPATDQRATDQRAGLSSAPATSLLNAQDLETVTHRWHEIQAGFVDAPQQAVKDADALVSDLMERLVQGFAAERHQLESHWSRGDQVSTEDLRVALQRYRSFFQRLLAVH